MKGLMRIYWDAQRTLTDEAARKRRLAALAAAEAAESDTEVNIEDKDTEEN
jgi:hypothetical protein